MNKEILKKYSEKSGISVEDLENQFNDLYDRYGTEKQALLKLKGSIQRDNGSLKSQAIMWKGFIVADTGIIDIVELMKLKAKRMFENPATRAMAIKSKLVTKEGMPIDKRKEVDFAPNPNYMGELKGHSYMRKMYGWCGLGSNMENPKFFQINWNNEQAQRDDVNFELYKTYMFRCTKGQTDKNMYKLNAKGVTRFSLVDDISLEEKCNIINESGVVKKVSNIEQVFALNKDSKRDNRTDQGCAIVLTGIASQIDYTPNERNNRRIDVNDEDMWEGSYTCWVPENVPLDFGEDSPVVIVGSITKGEFNEKVQYSINADGIFPLLGYFKRESIL